MVIGREKKNIISSWFFRKPDLSGYFRKNNHDIIFLKKMI